jgi:glycogen operon protein
VEEHQDIVRFMRGMSALRRAHPILSREVFYTDADITWCGPSGEAPRWSHSMAKALACVIHEEKRRAICLMFNAGAETVEFNVPTPELGARWHVAVDTSQDAPRDLFSPGEEPLWEGSTTYGLRPRASGILLAL